jgi:hypothetical protein
MRALSPDATIRRQAGATILLVLAIVGLHFTAMAAVVIVPNPLIAAPSGVVPPGLLAIVVTAVTAVIVLLGISGIVIDNKLAWHAAHEAVRLRESVNRLRQSERHPARAGDG